MGKPFQKEIEKIYETYSWGLNQSTDKIEEYIFSDPEKPLIAIGSGGSLSACHYAVTLSQSKGIIAKATTPLDLYYSKEIINKSNLLFISASGRNTDILFGFKIAIEKEPNSITSICMREDSQLSILSKKYSISKSFDYVLPSGKDGFLATNSLIAYFTILYKIFNNYSIYKNLEKPDNSFFTSLETFTNEVTNNFTFHLLYGGWGQPIATDIESKFTEAALGNVLLSDYRNFGHGRHHWLAKRHDNSAIIALITPYEKDIAYKTLALVPKEIPRMIINSNFNNSFSSIDLLAKSFYLVSKMGIKQGLDPGKPGVPDFGSKIYHLKYSSFYKNTDFPNIPAQAKLAILRKTKRSSLNFLSEDERKFWLDKYNIFIKQLKSEKFGAIVFDYDGTLCSSENRYTVPSKEIVNELIRILNAGFIIGIATGRGKSVRESLQKSIPESLWRNIIVGYYNGSDIGRLDNDALPNISIDNHESIKEAKSIIDNILKFNPEIKPKTRPFQISIEVSDQQKFNTLKNQIQNKIMSLPLSEPVQIVESSHSIDIIVKGKASKLNVIKTCRQYCFEKGLSSLVLCIGDKGQWPGNDFELLSTPYSLSVDEISNDPDTCWNISSIGIKNSDTLHEYLKNIQIKDNSLVYI